MTEPIRGFKGEHRFLSNFEPCDVRVSGTVYPSAEHAYVAMKTDNPDVRAEIAALPTAARAKAFGRHRSFPLRANWNEIRLGAMYVVVQSKFHQCPELAEKLKGTGDAELVEENSWGDTFWGVSDGEGDNWLGVVLMSVREELFRSEGFETSVMRTLHRYVEGRAAVQGVESFLSVCSGDD